MKRKNIEDFFKPIKQKKVDGEDEKNCGKELVEALKTVQRISEKKEITKKSLPKAFDIIMSTSQSSFTSTFFLEYKGKINNKHSWSYQFKSKIEGIYNSKPHKLKQTSTDTRSITLTFGTSHCSLPHSYGLLARPSFSPSILKSILQKAVRRCNRNSSIKTALQLIANCGIQELCRRLCIIVFEDAFLHPDYPLLVWCMGANDILYTSEMFESILQIVSDLACVKYRDVCLNDEKCDVYKLWKEGDEVIKCILIRALYRGMTGDVKMLQDYAVIWSKRMKINEWKNMAEGIYEGLPVVTVDEIVSTFSFADVIIEGVDFHCSNMLQHLLDQEKIIRLSCKKPDLEGYLKSAIWNNRSKINNKQLINLHPIVGTLCTPFEEDPEIIDEFFTDVLLPLIDAFSISELMKRFKRHTS